jgi:HK97 family phage major capsid protein
MELKEQLEALTVKLEGKSKDEVKNAIEAFETKNNEAIANEVKAVKDELESQLKSLQNHADKLDVKLQEKKADEVKKDAVKSAISENFENLSKVRKGNAVQIKAVGDMTLGNVTGDEPRDYNFDVVLVPGQLANVSDLAGNVSISGGTYTYVRETGGEGSISAQTEGDSKSQKDYDFSMLDVNTDFIAGFTRYSKKMKNNLPFLESFIPKALRRDYMIAENSAFNTVLASDATASTEIITNQNKIEMLIAEIAKLEGSNYSTNGIVVTPADYWDILITEKSTGAGYGLPGVVTSEGGQLRINGIPVFKATWVAANKYFVGDWSRVNKVTTDGLSLDFSEEEGTNFVKNNITARIEAQVALAVEQPAALVYGDFTAV